MLPSAFAVNRHYAILDPIRFAAALLVLAFHAAGAFLPAQTFAATGIAFVRGGWAGVDLFFVISGLVVGMAAQREWQATPTSYRSRFLLKRLARIAPLYLVTCAVYLAFVDDAVLRGDSAWRQVLSHVSFTHNFWPDTMMSINGATWSLSNEFQLYLILILATPWLARRSPKAILLLAFGIALAWRVGSYLALIHFFPENGQVLAQHYGLVTPGMIDSFGAGVALAVWRGRGGELAQRWRWLNGVFLLGLPLALWHAGTVTVQSLQANIGYALLMHSVLAALLALFLLGALELSQRHLATGHHWLRHLGDLSYGIYLWHGIVLVLVQRAMPDSPGLLRLVAVVVLSLVLAWIGFRLIERPVLTRIQAWLKARAAIPTPAS